MELSSNVISYDGEESTVKSIAWIKSFSDEIRERMTSYDEFGNPYLNPEYLGKVMELDGQCFSPRSKHLVHARIVEWRPDKTSDDCVILQSDIDQQVV